MANASGNQSYTDATVSFWSDPIGGLKSIFSSDGPSPTVANAVTGQVTQDQLKTIEAGAYNDVLNAGGSPAEAAAAAAQIQNFNQTQQGGTADQTLSAWGSALKTGLLGTAAGLVIVLIVVVIVMHEANN